LTSSTSVIYCTNDYVGHNVGFLVGLPIFILCFFSLLIIGLFDCSFYANSKIAKNESRQLGNYPQTLQIDEKVSPADVQIEMKNENPPAETDGVMTSHQNKFDGLELNDEYAGFCVSTYQTLIDTHLFISAYFPTKNNSIPRLVRIVLLYLVLSVDFFFNAVFYTDDMIQQRNYYYPYQDTFWDVIIYQIGKSVSAMLISFALWVICAMIFGCCSGKETSRKIAFVGLTIFATLMHIFDWYYITTFCGVYRKTQIGWLYGGLLTFLVSFGIMQLIFIPLTLVIVRKMVRYCKF